MILIEHDNINRSNTSIEAAWNVRIAMLAFLAALFMFKLAEPLHELIAQKHNREVLSLRAWRFRNGWRPR